MFKFKFQKALEYKLQIEDEAKYLLLKKKEEEQAEQEKLENIIESEKKFMLEYKNIKTGKLDINKMVEYQSYLDKIEKEKELQKEAVEQAEMEVEKAEKDYFEARKDRKIFDKLKEKAESDYNKEEQKKEQNLMDEISNNIFNRRR